MSPRMVWLGVPVLVVAVCVALLGAPNGSAQASHPLEAALPQNQVLTTTAVARVVVTPAQFHYPVGQVLTVTVQLDNVSDFYGGELKWDFNKDAFQVIDMDDQRPGVQVRRGSIFPPSAILVPINSGQADNETGEILVGGTLISGTLPFSGSGSLFIINFIVTAWNADLPLVTTPETLSLSDGRGIFLPFETGPGYLIRASPNYLLLPYLSKRHP